MSDIFVIYSKPENIDKTTNVSSELKAKIIIVQS